MLGDGPAFENAPGGPAAAKSTYVDWDSARTGGAAASPGKHLVFAQATIGTGRPVTAACPAGELALAGGWAASGGAPIYNSSRSGNGWQVYATTSGALVNAYVMCLQHVPGASVAQRFSQISVAAGGTAGGSTPCAGGEVLVGGGFADQEHVVVYNSSPSGSNGWEADLYNPNASSNLLNVYAMCLAFA